MRAVRWKQSFMIQWPWTESIVWKSICSWKNYCRKLCAWNSLLSFLHTELWIKAESRILHRNSHLRIHASTTHDDNFLPHLVMNKRLFNLQHMATIPFFFCEAICKTFSAASEVKFCLQKKNSLMFLFLLSVQIISTHNVENVNSFVTWHFKSVFTLA